MLLLAAIAGAKLIVMGHQPVVVHYPSMSRCLAAKAAIERQAAEDQARAGQYVIVPRPVVYCVPE